MILQGTSDISVKYFFSCYFEKKRKLGGRKAIMHLVQDSAECHEKEKQNYVILS